MKKIIQIIFLIIAILLPIPMNIITKHYNQLRHLTYNIFPYTVCVNLCFFLIGIFIGSYHFVQIIQKKGKWTISRFSLGLSLIFILLQFLQYFFLFLPADYFSFDCQDFYFTFAILGGYLLITSFYKKPPVDEKNI